ncbi:hypothetical protein [Streptomyces montanisoli]|uniref:hypothetical protein n=1 Tax=Streptomyces montanisoli TaxID=2798581 RepID=UPI001FD773C6|nr:hypothetical protein [Streptomyces montanisoli]
MAEDSRARAAQGDIEAIAALLQALDHPNLAPPADRAAAAGATPRTLWSWLDAAQAHRPHSDRHAERMYAFHLGGVAARLVPLAAKTGEPWNALLAHPLFTSDVTTAPEPPAPEPFAPVPFAPGPPARVPAPVPSPYADAQGQPAGIPDQVFEAAAFAVTVGVVPFLQTLATQAAQRTFDAARATIRERLRRGEGRIAGPNLVIEERDGRLAFRVPSEVPDAALEALVALGDRGLESLATPDPRGRAVTVTWNATDGRWERLVQDVGLGG